MIQVLYHSPFSHSRLVLPCSSTGIHVLRHVETLPTSSRTLRGQSAPECLVIKCRYHGGGSAVPDLRECDLGPMPMAG
jgi:hypothetical protein